LTEMQRLIKEIERANDAYYLHDDPIMTDKQYDELCAQLENLEKETGIVLANSPIHRVSGGVIKSLQKVKHSFPMLSANKTKNVEDVRSFMDRRVLVASWKMDGLTLVLRYNDGELMQAITRGDGTTGEDVTHNARMITNLPLKIPFKGHLELRGECVISWESFKKIDLKASHPRNLAAGSIRQLDSKIAKQRKLSFFAFDHIDTGFKLKSESLQFLKEQGFEVVPHVVIRLADELDAAIEQFDPDKFEYPVDGIVFEYNNIEYGRSIGSTAHHEKRLIALKWADDLYETTFRSVEFNTNRSGVISITAVFDPVDIDGAMVSRATLHNPIYFLKLKLGAGDTIRVYKANMIIPQVFDNLTRSGGCELPTQCPSCGGEIIWQNDNMYCGNPNCPKKQLERFVYFCGKNGFDIKGLSHSTIEKLIDAGLITDAKSLLYLFEQKEKALELEGFGKRKFALISQAIYMARRTSTLATFLSSLAIPGVGVETAKVIAEHFHWKKKEFLNAIENNFDFARIDGIGEITANSMREFFATDTWWKPLSECLTMRIPFEKDQARGEFAGKTVAITGVFDDFERSEIKKILESKGAKVAASVGTKTDILLAGNKAGSKLQKAKDYNVKIMNEAEFAKLCELD